MITIKAYHVESEALECFVRTDNGTPLTNIPSSNLLCDLANNNCTEEGCTAKENCYIGIGISPILSFFSRIKSYEKVCLEVTDNQSECKFVLPAQNACFCISLYVSLHSGCRFFSQFKFLSEYTKFNIEPKNYIYVMLATSLINMYIIQHKQFDVDVFRNSLEQLCTQYKEKLLYIIGLAKNFKNEDAAINSAIMAFNLNEIMILDFENYLNEMTKTFNFGY